MKIGWSRSFSVGAVAFIFLVIGYQIAVFVHKAAVAAIVADGAGLESVATVAPDNGSSAGGGSLDGGSRHSEAKRQRSEESRAHHPSSVARHSEVEHGVRSEESCVHHPSTSSHHPSSASRHSEGSGATEESRVVEGGPASVTSSHHSEGSASHHPSTSSHHPSSTASRHSEAKPAGRSEESRAPSSRNGEVHRAQSSVTRKQEVRTEIKRKFTPSKEFRFNPNTASLDDFILLGFTEKQAQSILNYRDKGGRFYRKSDFARSFVVSDEIYARLEPYIDIPLLDINVADSAAFDALPGIGGYFAKKMVEYRARLGGRYSSPEQLLEIYNFGQDRYDRLKDLIFVGSCPSLPVLRLWSAPEDSLKTHPYIGSWKAAHAIQTYKSVTPRSDWSIDGLVSAGIFSPVTADKLRRYYILE